MVNNTNSIDCPGQQMVFSEFFSSGLCNEAMTTVVPWQQRILHHYVRETEKIGGKRVSRQDSVTAFESSGILRDPVVTSVAHVVGVSMVPHGDTFYGVQICDCTCTVSFLENSGKGSGGLGMHSFLFQKILVLGLGPWMVVLPPSMLQLQHDPSLAQAQLFCLQNSRVSSGEKKNPNPKPQKTTVPPSQSFSLPVAKQCSFPRTFAYSGPQ